MKVNMNVYFISVNPCMNFSGHFCCSMENGVFKYLHVESLNQNFINSHLKFCMALSCFLNIWQPASFWALFTSNSTIVQNCTCLYIDLLASNGFVHMKMAIFNFATSTVTLHFKFLELNTGENSLCITYILSNRLPILRITIELL